MNPLQVPDLKGAKYLLSLRHLLSLLCHSVIMISSVVFSIRRAKLVSTMHERGIRHRDLKSSNILAQKIPGQPEKLYLVDLDSTGIKKRSTKKDAIKDLARLNASLLDTKTVSTPDRLRFLKYYLHVRKTKNQKAREYWGSIVFYTKKKLKKAGRKFNPGK